MELETTVVGHDTVCTLKYSTVVFMYALYTSGRNPLFMYSLVTGKGFCFSCYVGYSLAAVQ